ncbi:tRNA pseudouridine(38-40) synthase TruA [Rhodoferax sp.]|uniref:tRNA pseudouridine(38-40) synthase TruA n=1 Tax=Rhodoferax sp. TaxID=50421 RepID=UPI002622E79D|nr:tRNA pseudouridine(38-40) synthase TruA [Rhodoferax sp.]MDD2917424.1 tRNA pseudouridine(38-40) synthase TruA [Rhodoferax sp.]
MGSDPQALVRVALGISYHGGHYQGWQSQSSRQTVQDQLEKALGRFANHRVSTLCAGRTDAGVHGLMQVVHFDTPLARPEPSWVRGPNALLPRDIAVQWAKVVPKRFHCRASAVSRRYVYVVLQSSVRPSLDQGRVGWVYRPLRLEPMQQAAQQLVGEHDFTSFRASACQALSPVKNMLRIAISQRGAYWRFEFEANAFLHHMIRNLMGCLIAIGDQRHPPEWINTVLAARDRDAAAPTFSPDGLYFLGPRYEPHWGLPEDSPLLDGLP